VRALAGLLFGGVVSGVAAFGAAEAASRRASPAALIAAAQSASISEVDYTRSNCGDNRRIGDWLKHVLDATAKSIIWSAGTCQLVTENNPNDSGASASCAQAMITPKQGGEPATIEIFFEAPRNGRPGKPFAFRAAVHTKDGWDYMRDTRAFQVNWRETYASDYVEPDGDGSCN